MPETFIPVAKPWLGGRELAAIERVLASGWVTQGPEVTMFEREFATYVGAAHACAVSSCTTALHLALLAVGVRPGDEVITVSHTFIATANSIRQCGALPVFVDIQPGTFNIEPGRIEEAITPRTRAILCVHQLGMPCDLAAILPLARRHALAVIEDAACAIGSEILWRGRWEKIGRPHGDIACFSFHPRKVMTTGDGGMLTTANPDWDRQFRLWRQHGMSVPDSVRHGAREVVFESYPVPGFNYRMTDLQAAMGRVQLDRLPEMLERRRHLAERYRRLLHGADGLVLPEEPSWARSNWQSFCIRAAAGQQRRLMQTLLDAGIASRRGVMCVHREEAYAGNAWRSGAPHPHAHCPSGRCRALSQSEQAQDTGIILPLYHEMTEAAQDRVAWILREAIAARGQAA